MATVPIFTGTVDDAARLTLTERERDQRRAWLETLKGRDVEVVIRRRRRQRSTDQNALIHAVATALAEHCGVSLGEMKVLLMGECWGWRTVRGHEVPVKPHTSDMTVEEATDFIDWLLPWTATNFPSVRLDAKRVAA